MHIKVENRRPELEPGVGEVTAQETCVKKRSGRSSTAGFTSRKGFEVI